MGPINGESLTEEAVVYQAKTADGWGIEMVGTEPADDSDIDHAGIIGQSITNFKIGGRIVKKARVRNSRGKWLAYNSGMNIELGNNKPITGIEIVGSGLAYAIHVKGGQWLPRIITSDVEGEQLATAGAIDAIWIDEI